jgi:hypothetical protein
MTQPPDIHSAMPILHQRMPQLQANNVCGRGQKLLNANG